MSGDVLAERRPPGGRKRPDRRRRPRSEGLGGTYDPAPLMALFHNADDYEIAQRLGVSRSAVRFWRTGDRRISAGVADEITIRIGLHPVLLWPEWGNHRPAGRHG